MNKEISIIHILLLFVTNISNIDALAPRTIFNHKYKHMYEDFKKHYQKLTKNNWEGISNTFATFPQTVTDPDIFHKNDYIALNRYSDILPRTNSRVKITSQKRTDPSQDYINASWLDPNTKHQQEDIIENTIYIAAQAPTQPAIPDMWQMVWEKNIKIINMVTKEVERSQTKVHRYWPKEGETKRYGSYSINLSEKKIEGNYIQRTFEITNSDLSETRTIKHFQYTAWPDHGVPENVIDFLEFRKKIKAEQKSLQKEPSNEGPLLTHCSAGVGRTGVFIVADSILNEIEKGKVIQANKIDWLIKKFREESRWVVQTKEQYEFIYRVILHVLDEMQKSEKEILKTSPIQEKPVKVTLRSGGSGLHQYNLIISPDDYELIKKLLDKDNIEMNRNHDLINSKDGFKEALKPKNPIIYYQHTPNVQKRIYA